MNETEILTKIMNGEKMASEIIHTYMDKLEDSDLRQTMEDWIKNHQNNAERISYYLQQKGEIPNEGTGVVGWMANTKAKINTFLHQEPIDILHEIYDGEDKGIARSVQISKGDLSSEATGIIEEIFSNDHTHLESMKKFITEYENNPNHKQQH